MTRAAAPASGTNAPSRWRQPWPSVLWVVRHGQSAGNVARDAAELAGLPRIDIDWRDIDTPLSDLGRQQSAALGSWFASLPADEQPEIVLCSPYIRALETARIVAGGRLPEGLRLRVDERLREKEFGILDRLTHRGITQKFPELSEQRSHVGKFYFRPPGGESWCDVILRLRSLLEMVTREYEGRRVLLVCHQVIVNCMRYLVEQLDEDAILAIDRLGDVPNCSVTSYRLQEQPGSDGMGLALDLVNFTAPLEVAHTPVTVAADQPQAAKP